MRGVEDGLRIGGFHVFMLSCILDRGGGGDVGNVVRVWCVKNLRGDAQPSPYRVLFVAPGRRVWRARRRSTRLRARRGAVSAGLLVSGDEKPF